METVFNIDLNFHRFLFFYMTQVNSFTFARMSSCGIFLRFIDVSPTNEESSTSTDRR